MKRLRIYLILLIALLSVLLLAATVAAQEGVTATPTQLTVTGPRGAVETRTLLLRASSPITNLQIIPLDLPRTDGQAVLPAKAISVTLPADEIAAGSLLTIPINFDLSHAPSGEFSGELLLNYHGDALAVPVTVRVKTSWPLPLAVLLVGVGLGIGVSTYRVRGRWRDQILVRVGQLRDQVQADTALNEQAEPFLARIEAHLLDVTAALRAEKWSEAQTAVGQAEAVLLKWRKLRAEWLEQLAYQAELVQQVNALNPDAFYLRAVRRDLDKAVQDAPDLADPDELRDQLDGLVQKINRYLQLQAGLQQLNSLRHRLSASEAETWQRKIQNLTWRLDKLDPDAEDDYLTLEDEVSAAIDELTALASQRGGPEAKGVATGAAAPHLLLPAPGRGRQVSPPAPPTEEQGCLTSLFSFRSSPPRLPTATEQAGQARARLRAFTLTSYVIAVTLLAGAGFSELYIANATFGANAWADYFALLAWGFGAEATRAAIAQMVRNWGLPGLE